MEERSRISLTCWSIFPHVKSFQKLVLKNLSLVDVLASGLPAVPTTFDQVNR